MSYIMCILILVSTVLSTRFFMVMAFAQQASVDLQRIQNDESLIASYNSAMQATEQDLNSLINDPQAANTIESNPTLNAIVTNIEGNAVQSNAIANAQTI